MAIAFDVSATDASDWTSGTTHSSNSFTVANVASRVMFCTVFISNGDFLSSLKWNTSETFTLGTKLQNPGNEWVYIYYLLNPTATTSTVNAIASTAPTHARIVVNVYNGAGTPTQFSSQTASTTTFTDTLTVSANSWIVGCCGTQRTSTAGAGTLIRNQVQALALADSNSALSAGSHSIVFNFSSIQQVSLWCELPVGSNVWSFTLTDSVSYGASRTAAIGRVYGSLRTLSDSISRSASRAISLGQLGTYARSASASIVNAANRLATVGKGYLASLSASIMNAASRTTSITLIRGALRTLSDSIMNGASRSVTLGRILSSLRNVSDLLMNAASRVVTVSRAATMARSISGSFMNAASRLVSISIKLNGTAVIWTHVTKSADVAWTKVSKSTAAVWTHITRN